MDQFRLADLLTFFARPPRLPAMDSRFPPGRRRFLLGSAATVGASLLIPSGARASGPRVLIIGSSTMGGALGRLLLNQFESAGLRAFRKAKASSGLARPDFFDWPTVAGDLQREHRPDATVVMFGGNDGQSLYMGKRSTPPWVRWHEPEWYETYSQRVRQFADAVAPNGEHVYWIGMPVVKSSKLNNKVQRMNKIYTAEMMRRRNGSFLDTTPVFSSPEGKYLDRVVIGGKRVKVRAPDGVHLTMAGARLLANHVAPTVRWGLAVAL